MKLNIVHYNSQLLKSHFIFLVLVLKAADKQSRSCITAGNISTASGNRVQCLITLVSDVAQTKPVTGHTLSQTSKMFIPLTHIHTFVLGTNSRWTSPSWHGLTHERMRQRLWIVDEPARRRRKEVYQREGGGRNGARLTKREGGGRR